MAFHPLRKRMGVTNMMPGSLSRKDMLVRAAIREIAEKEGHPEDFSLVNTKDIFNHMKSKGVGKYWLSKNSITQIRKKLPEHYREKKE